MTGRRPLVQMLIAVAILVVAAVPAWAVDDTTGRVTIQTMTVGAGLGVAWGDGVLEYRGERYPFTVRGISLGDVGVAKTTATGMVFNLKNVDDFAGMFATAVAGGTLGGGAGAGAMHNQNDVSMVWTGTNQGLALSLAHSGVSVQLTEQALQKAAKVGRKPYGELQPAAAPRTTE